MKTSRDILVIIGAGRHQISLIKEAKRLGFYTVAVDKDKYADGFMYSDYKIVHDAYDYRGILRSLRKRIEVNRVKGVLTQAARGCIVTVSKISEELGLRCLNSKVAENTIDKKYTAKLFRQYIFMGVFRRKEILKENLAYPIVIKNGEQSGNLGVYKVKDRKELFSVLKCINETDEIIVEKYKKGRNIGVIGIKSKNTIKTYGMIEKYLNADMTIDYTVYPAGLSKNDRNKIKNYVLYALRKLKFDYGPFQAELILDKKGKIYFVETEASLLGSYISEIMIPSAGTNNMILEYIKLTVSGKMKKTVNNNKYVSIQKYHYANKCGILKGWDISGCNRNVTFIPYLSCGGKIINNRLYVANSLAIGKNIKDAKNIFKGYKVSALVK